MARATPLRAAVVLTAALGLAGCGPKLVRQRLTDQPNVRVELRHREQGGEVLPRGYAHPATISDVRVAHVLGNLVFEDGEEKQRPVIRAAEIYPLGEGIAKALEQATPNDEVAAAVFPTDRRLGIFTDERVTAFRVFVEGDELKFEFYLVEAPLEKAGDKLSYREWEIPSEPANSTPPFKLVPGKAQTRMGPDGLAVAWRDEHFRKPVALQQRGRRRTVLMELPPEQEEGATAPAKSALPPGLSEQQIRALDEAEADRSSGALSESQYQRARRLILENKLDEAGYGKDP